ncbi:MAG: response regulator, partial [Clostridia bacterium]|nr:response regulator [Clostridia bacterium]
MHVLVVEDEPIMRKMYESLFNWTEQGFHLVGVAPNALKALEIMRSEPVDVIITDIKMPQMSGIELIRCAKEE